MCSLCREIDVSNIQVKAVRNGDLKILPEFHHQTWYNWLENIQDSGQLEKNGRLFGLSFFGCSVVL